MCVHVCVCVCVHVCVLAHALQSRYEKRGRGRNLIPLRTLLGARAGVPHEYPHLHHVTTHTVTKSLPNPHFHHVTTHTFIMSLPTPSSCHYPHLHQVSTLFAPMRDHIVCSNVGVMSRNLGWLQTCPLSCSLLLTLLDF